MNPETKICQNCKSSFIIEPEDFKFYEQMKELLGKMPLPALLNINAVKSEYCNYTFSNKNCYLVFGGDFNEDCAYGTFNMYSKDSFDLYWVNKCELCYEDIDSENCYKVLKVP